MKLLWVENWWVPLVLPLVLLLLWRGQRAASRRLDRFAHPRRQEELTGLVHRRRRRLRTLFLLAALALGSLAALGPSYGYTLRPVRHRGVDMLFLLDLSRSMLASDLRPSRLERARRDLGGLLSRLTGERVGLVGFSGSASLICPLTHDYGTFDTLLDGADPRMPTIGGTDLGTGLQRALAALGEGYEKHQAIIILSDGEDLGGEWRQALSAAVERKVRVYGVGYGTPAGAKITITEEGRQQFLTDPEGKEVVTRLREETLRAAARETGGEYLRADTNPLPLEEILDKRIKAIEKREFEQEKRRVPWNRYQWFLALAVLLLLGRMFLWEGRRTWT